MPAASLLNLSEGLSEGLNEKGALTALIGSTTATSHVPQNKGTAGLLGITMSIFEALLVIRARAAAGTLD